MITFVDMKQKVGVSETIQVRVRRDLQAKVAKKLKGKRRSIGGYYDEAVEEKLKRDSK